MPLRSHGAKLRAERRAHEKAMKQQAHESAMAQERLRQKAKTERAAMKLEDKGGETGGGLSAGGGGAGGEGGWEPPPVRGPSRYETEELEGGGTRTYDWIGGQGREGGLRPRMGEGGRWMTASTGEQGTEGYREYKVWQRDRPKPPMSPEMYEARTRRQALKAEIKATAEQKATGQDTAIAEHALALFNSGAAETYEGAWKMARKAFGGGGPKVDIPDPDKDTDPDKDKEDVEDERAGLRPGREPLFTPREPMQYRTPLQMLASPVTQSLYGYKNLGQWMGHFGRKIGKWATSPVETKGTGLGPARVKRIENILGYDPWDRD